MPNAEDVPSRVRDYLRRGGPCTHRYMQIDGGFLVCEDCRPLQRQDLSICLICEQPGIIAVTLRDLREPGMECAGRLCQQCAAEFAERGTIDGWIAIMREAA